MDTPAARAVLAFFQSWQPEAAPEHPALAEYWEDILSGANLIFRYDGGFVHDDPAIRRAWERHYGGSGDDGGTEMVCLVTGEKGPVENTHPSVKGVQGAQSSGAALVSFNAPAFCSYGREQNPERPHQQGRRLRLHHRAELPALRPGARLSHGRRHGGFLGKKR